MIRVCGVDEPGRLLPLVHFLIVAIVHVVIYVSIALYNTNPTPVPQHIVASSILTTFGDKTVQFLHAASSSVGSLLILDILLEVLIFVFSSKFSKARKNNSSEESKWPSDKLVENVKDWLIRLLLSIAIVIPPLMMILLPLDQHLAVYASAFRVFRYTTFVCAISISISDTIDRNWQHYLVSVSLNLIYCISELIYYFYSIQEQTPYTNGVITSVKTLRTTAIALIVFRAAVYLLLILRSYRKRGELRLRRLYSKEWKFLIYTAMFIAGAAVCLGLSGVDGGFNFYATTPLSQIQYTILFIVCAMVTSMLPQAVSRYEVARAEVS
jgi:hypothetical protein